MHLCLRTTQCVLEKPARRFKRQPLPKACPVPARGFELARQPLQRPARLQFPSLCHQKGVRGGCKYPFCHIVDKASPLKRLGAGGNGTFSVTRVYPSALIFSSSGNRAIFICSQTLNSSLERELFILAYTCIYLYVLVYV